MKKELVDISTFGEDANFYGRIEMLLTVKSFDLQAIRKRYLASRSRKDNKTGSVERREVAVGGIVHAVIENGELTKAEVLAKMKEPRGIGANEKLLGVSSENEVHIIGDEHYSIKDPWFSYIHTIDFHPDENKVLVSSSGLDCILEYDLNTRERSYEWFAWENGFSQGTDPKTGKSVTLTRNPDLKGENVKLILDPQKDVLPTAMRAAFINSVVYDSADPDSLIATFFHEGAVYGINKESNIASKLLEGLKNPHGGGRHHEAVYATSTGNGEVVSLLGDIRRELKFNNLNGKPIELGDMEWLQNSHFNGENLVTIDSNRTAFVISNGDKQVKNVVPYDHNWAVQDMVMGEFSESQLKSIRSLSL